MDKLSKHKQAAAEFAVDQFIQSGMTVGLGVGSTAIFAVERIAERLREGSLKDLAAVPCSIATGNTAREMGIPLVGFSPDLSIDVTIDGADEVDPQLNLIKGGGGALLREKIVAQISKREIIVIDESKRSDSLGNKWAVPIEVTKFGWESQIGYLTSLGANPELRVTKTGSPYETDQGNLIIDGDFGAIKNPADLDSQLNQRAGIVEHGLFIGIATDLVIAGQAGINQIQR